MDSNSDIIGLDVGQKRIGVARVSLQAKIPQALQIIENDAQVKEKIKKICEAHNCKEIVIGVPHNMSGEETDQSRQILAFGKELGEFLGKNYRQVYVDESLSTVLAREQYPNEKHIDDKAAAIILENYVREHVS